MSKSKTKKKAAGATRTTQAARYRSRRQGVGRQSLEANVAQLLAYLGEVRVRDSCIQMLADVAEDYMRAVTLRCIASDVCSDGAVLARAHQGTRRLKADALMHVLREDGEKTTAMARTSAASSVRRKKEASAADKPGAHATVEGKRSGRKRARDRSAPSRGHPKSKKRMAAAAAQVVKQRQESRRKSSQSKAAEEDVDENPLAMLG